MTWGSVPPTTAVGLVAGARKGELSRLEHTLLERAGPTGAFVHGPVGSGKSSLLALLGAGAHDRGWTVATVRGALSPASLEVAMDALGGAEDPARTLLLLDDCDVRLSHSRYLLELATDTGRAPAALAVSSRLPPRAAWYDADWSHVATEVELLPLDDTAAAAMAEHRALSPEAATDVIEWADGSPLALDLALSAAECDPGWEPSVGTRQLDFVERTLRRLGLTDTSADGRVALEVASMIRVLTPEILAEVLPGRDTRPAYEWLSRSTLARQTGFGLELHDIVSRTVRRHLSAVDPDRDRMLRRSVADVLYERAIAGEAELTADLAALSANDRIATGYGWHLPSGCSMRHARETDRPLIAEHLQRVSPGWWPLVSGFLEHTPERVVIIAAQDGRPLAGVIAVTPQNAPQHAEEDPILGPRLRYARASCEGPATVVWGPSFVLGRCGPHRHRQLRATANVAAILRSGVTNPRTALLMIKSHSEIDRGFAAALQGEHVEELDAVVDERHCRCYRVDCGPGGLIAAQRDLVRYELGLCRHPLEAGVPGADREAIREAIRGYQRPPVLMTSPLATGNTVAERVGSVRELVDRALANAFGERVDELEMRRILVEAYIAPGGDRHEASAQRHGLSRTTYFRRLRHALERVVDHVDVA